MTLRKTIPYIYLLPTAYIFFKIYYEYYLFILKGIANMTFYFFKREKEKKERKKCFRKTIDTVMLQIGKSYFNITK